MQVMAEQASSTTTATRPPTAFVSGPVDANQAYFETYYKGRIDEAFDAGHSFIIGPVHGVDRMALIYIVQRLNGNSTQTAGVMDRVTVYMAEFEIKTPGWYDEIFKMLGKPPTKADDMVGGESGPRFTCSWQRDAAMTANSDYDILRWRTEDEQKLAFKDLWKARVSNTEHNARRRAHREKLGTNDGYIEGEQLYIVHIEPGQDRVARDSSGAVRALLRTMVMRKSSDDKKEVCDGLCDGHRDVVKTGEGGKPFGWR